MEAKIGVTDGGDYVWFRCPGCGHRHTLPVRDRHVERPSWEWNKSVDRPTFTPSILASGSAWENRVCHSFVTDGNIEFLNDCTHELAGQTVPLPSHNG